MTRADFFAGVRPPLVGGSLVVCTECLLTAMEFALWPLARTPIMVWRWAITRQTRPCKPIAEYGHGKGKACDKLEAGPVIRCTQHLLKRAGLGCMRLRSGGN